VENLNRYSNFVKSEDKQQYSGYFTANTEKLQIAEKCEIILLQYKVVVIQYSDLESDLNKFHPLLSLKENKVSEICGAIWQ